MQVHMGGAAPCLVCFNLGYLPWTDKAVMTTPATTRAAVQAGLDCLKPGGVLSVISYLGHEGEHGMARRLQSSRKGVQGCRLV